MPRGVPDRFWEKVDVGGVCWEWTAAKTRQGYGNFWTGARYIGAHRWAYESLVGSIPKGLILDHLCRNRACVNPDHVEPVTYGENYRRGLRGMRRYYCPAGHEVRGDNLYVSPEGYNQCKACRRARSQELRDRRKLVNYAQGRTE